MPLSKEERAAIALEHKAKADKMLEEAMNRKGSVKRKHNQVTTKAPKEERLDTSSQKKRTKTMHEQPSPSKRTKLARGRDGKRDDQPIRGSTSAATFEMAINRLNSSQNTLNKFGHRSSSRLPSNFDFDEKAAADELVAEIDAPASSRSQKVPAPRSFKPPVSTFSSHLPARAPVSERAPRQTFAQGPNKNATWLRRGLTATRQAKQVHSEGRSQTQASPSAATASPAPFCEELKEVEQNGDVTFHLSPPSTAAPKKEDAPFHMPPPSTVEVEDELEVVDTGRTHKDDDEEESEEESEEETDDEPQQGTSKLTYLMSGGVGAVLSVAIYSALAASGAPV